MSIAESTLSEELFSGKDRAALLELAEKSTRAKLHPVVLGFINNVERILQAVNTGVQEPITVAEPGNRTTIHLTQTGRDYAGHLPQAQAESTEIGKIGHTPQQEHTETGKRPSGNRTTSEMIREFLYLKPDTSLRALVEHTGATIRAVKAGLTALKSLGQVEFDRLQLTEYGRRVVEGIRAPAQTEAAKPAAQIPATPAQREVADPQAIIPAQTRPSARVPAKPHTKPFAARPKTNLPDDLAFSEILGLAIEKLRPETQEIIRRRALNILGKRLHGEIPYSYKQLRAFEDFASAVERVLANGGGSEDVLNALQDFRPQAEPGITPAANKRPAEQPTAWRPAVSYPVRPTEPARPPEIRTHEQPRPREPVRTQTAADYLSRLGIASPDLESRKQRAVRSYVWKMLGVQDGTPAENISADQSQLRALSVFTETFEKIQRLEDLPSELYDALDGLSQYDMQGIREFGSELNAARDSFDVLVAASKRIRSPYSKPADSMDDVYREDNSMIALFREKSGYLTDTVAARNSIPSLRVANFYGTINKIPRDLNWGGRYTDLLRLVRVDTRKAVKFMEWASSQGNINGSSFDREMAKYMRTGTRAQLIG